MKRARTIAALLALAVAGSAAAQEPAPAPAPVEAPAAEVVPLGTGAITGVYFPVGVALCRLVNQHRRETGLRCAATLSEGSVANIAALRSEVDALAIVQSDVQAAALAGEGPFAATGPFDGLAAVMGLYPEPLTLVVRADAGVAGVEDLAGKRVWLGPEGSGTRSLAGALIAALGWTEASLAPAEPDIRPEDVPRALCAGRIDAFFYVVGHPAPVVQEATTECAARLVPITGGAIEALVAANPALVLATIPAGLYRGTPAAVDTFGVSATLVTRASLPEDTIYTIVRAIFADFDTLRGLDPVLAGLDPEAMVHEGLTAPLHPGAARYYRERGWLE
jgi:TRAP transporter TAXI family solute receptor